MAQRRAYRWGSAVSASCSRSRLRPGLHTSSSSRFVRAVWCSPGRRSRPLGCICAASGDARRRHMRLQGSKIFAPDAWPHTEAPGEGAALRAHSLVKRFPGFQLGPVDLDVRLGHIYGLLGVNGAGKTTLLSCLAQQSAVSAGEILVGSRRVAWTDYSYRELVGFVRELPVLYEPLSAAQHVRLAARLFTRWDPALAEHWLDLFRIDRRKRVRHFSKGMRVKLALILALAHQPRFLLLDEPMNGIDIESRFELREFLQAIVADADAAILVASHVLQDVEALATDLIIIREGRIVFTSGYDALGSLAAWTLPPDGQMQIPPSHQLLRAWVDRRGPHLLTRGPVPILDMPVPSTNVRRASLEDVYLAFARGTDDKRMAPGQGTGD
ncbi:MAG: ATP-binding cassette domain-containing protein [Luteitalea sp.]|nr:ATP-binding cassette domain-containing protein [Luteitalea sp.]